VAEHVPVQILVTGIHGVNGPHVAAQVFAQRILQTRKPAETVVTAVAPAVPYVPGGSGLNVQARASAIQPRYSSKAVVIAEAKNAAVTMNALGLLGTNAQVKVSVDLGKSTARHAVCAAPEYATVRVSAIGPNLVHAPAKGFVLQVSWVTKRTLVATVERKPGPGPATPPVSGPIGANGMPARVKVFARPLILRVKPPSVETVERRNVPAPAVVFAHGADGASGMCAKMKVNAPWAPPRTMCRPAETVVLKPGPALAQTRAVGTAMVPGTPAQAKAPVHPTPRKP